ncbi:MAG TPA: hypothetical protein VJX69_11800 [Terriglobales bacterium]|nr:hypothetical protein [Terriglobales bacterium]
MLNAEVVLPLSEYFPDHYDATDEAVDVLFQRVCGYMQVDESQIDLEVFPDEAHELRAVVPFWHGDTGGPAGLYISATDQSRFVIAVRSSKLKDPLGVVATLAHELAHVILLGGNLVDRESQDMEPLTDLTTVFLGLGIFTANAAVQFEQHQDGRTQGWSLQRLGYLSEEMYGYALARFTFERSEDRPEWAKYLSTNVATYYKRSNRWLAQKARAKS